MLLETIVPLLPFILLGLIGLFAVLLLIEIQKQLPKSRARKTHTSNESIKSTVSLLIPLAIAAIFVYGLIKLDLDTSRVILITFTLAAIFGASQHSTQQQQQQQQQDSVVPSQKTQASSKKQRYQRVPIVPPKQPQFLSSFQSTSKRSDKETKPSSQHKLTRQCQRINPLQPKLLNLLNGDRAGAERLLRHAKQSNPGMGEDWYFEKVISDLIRDRR